MTPDGADRAPRRTFKIHACLGRGGYGEVYHATMFERDEHRDVALKVLHADLRDGEQAVARLRDERRMLAAVDHPCILRVHDLVVLEGRVGLVTEYVEGQDLDKCNVGEDSMPPRAVLDVVSRVADALDHAWHARSLGGGRLELVHRDVKPANVRVGRRGEVKLLDFGVARAENVGREAHTQSDTAMGSYPYMAPERFLDASARASGDVYGLGATAYEALAGERLWAVPVQELYKLVLNQTRYQRVLDERLDALALPELRPLLSALLHFEPQSRPTAAEARDRARELAATLKSEDLAGWAARRTWPPIRIIAGMLAGRVFEEDDVDPQTATHASDPFPAGWDAADQEPTVHVRRRSDAPTVLRTPPPAASRAPAPEARPRARPAAPASPAGPVRWRVAQVIVALVLFGLVLAGVFVATFTILFAILRQWG